LSQQQAGLRFDIYERVHLPGEVSAIRELDEVELIPQIQVAVEGEQAVVRGSLILAGTYSSEDETPSKETLRHTIPVEITLPMNRISSVDEISVEIDNFDVDLLSSRSLNVTGTLSLRGIGMAADAQEDWREEEEVVFVHQAEPDSDSGYKEETIPPAALQQQAPFAEIRQPFQPFQPPEAPGRDEIVEDTYEDLTLLDHYDSLSGGVTVEEDEQEPKVSLSQDEELGLESAEDEERKEMKIAFGSKKTEDGPSHDLKSYLHKTEGYRRADAAPAQQDPGGSAANSRDRSAEPSPADTLEWKKLFISESEEQKFKKVRLCIVQKEETLETIAKRYDRKPQEIRLYNRLSDQDVSEGQVIYIP
jgi:stage VI sporulation protein D